MTLGRTPTTVVGSLLWIALSGAPALAATFTVTTTDDGGQGSLRDALAQARSGDTISVAANGTIALTSGPLFVRQNVTIVGPGRAALAISSGGAFRVFAVGDAGPVTAAISGMTIRDGSSDYGGGIWNRGTLSLADVVLSANSASFFGGAIYNAGSLTLRNSSISGNTAVYRAGGIFSASGSALTIISSTFSSNASRVGGAIDNNDGAVSIADSTFVSNSARQSGAGAGGAIHNGGLAGSVTVNGSLIARNWTDGDGGAIYHGSGSLTISRSTLASNWSECAIGGCVGGGGVVSNSAPVFVNDSTLYANVTLARPYLGGNLVAFYGTTTVRHSILAGSGYNCRSYLATAIVSEGYNLSDDDTCVGSLTSVGDFNGVPAGLNPLGVRDNGGLTETIALLPTSPAIDAVPPDACTDSAGDPVYDQRGVSRPQSGGCDIGAFEVVFIPTALELAPLSPSSFIGGWPGPLTLSATLQRTDLPAAVAGAEVAFLLDGVRIATVTTDVTGRASISHDPSSLTVGSHSVQAIAARQLSGDDALERAGSAVQILQVTPSPYAAQVLQPIRGDGTSVFNLNRGVVPVKFALTYNDAATCTLPTATIRVTRLYGTQSGPVNENDYVLAADDGSTFRVESCQYVYNIATSSLGQATYIVSIVIDSIVVGSARFGLQ